MVACVANKPGGNFHLASARNVIQICDMSYDIARHLYKWDL